MNKQQLGDFIANNRKAAGLTQRALAERLHVTDKAVSKWERALSYPDVTLLEPLAEALGLGVEELMACRRIEAEKEDAPMRNLLEISRESLKTEQRKHVWRTALALALLLGGMLLLIWYISTYVREERESTIFLIETAGDETYLYVEEQGHLLRLKCGESVEASRLKQTNEWGQRLYYRMTCRWNRRTYEGTVSACEETGETYDWNYMDQTFQVEEAPLFGYSNVYYQNESRYPDPYAEPRGQVYLSSYRFWTGHWDRKQGEWLDMETVLRLEDCLSVAAADVDGDGQNELAVRTRWPEKPYQIYDYDEEDGEIVALWPEDLPPELKDELLCIWELPPELQEQKRQSWVWEIVLD